MERIDCKKDSEVWERDENILQLRHWASLRGQTLCRTGNDGFSLFIPVEEFG
jgi:callose synthase